MISFADYRRYDALGLAELVRTRKVSAEELLEAAIARTEAVNGKIGAVVLKHYDMARAAIREGLPQGPFHGVPYLLKDLSVALKGTVTTGGCRLMQEITPAASDSTLVERSKKAGLNIFGKTHSPELGLSPSSESALFGQTRNPWNLDRIAGGSSGGASAAVASAIVPMAQASDGGGSIRVPASACGLVGLKPSRGRIPLGPKRAEGWGGMSVVGVVSRSVRDTAAMLDATAGAAPGDPYAAPHQEMPYADAIRQPLRRLLIGLSSKPALPVAVHPDCQAAVETAAKLLESLGHAVEPFEPAIDPGPIIQAQGTILNANVTATLEEAAAARGVDLGPDWVEAATWMRVERGRTAKATEYVSAINTIHALGRQVEAAMGSVDLVLQPTMAQPPLPVGRLNMNRTDFDALFLELITMVPYTAIANMTGQPSISLPLYWSKEGLPIGVMLTARLGGEALLLRVAAQLEQAQPWDGRMAAL